MKILAIVGGGASGLMAALAAAKLKENKSPEAGFRTVVLEKNSRVGKKLLATGNGRCNFTNTQISAGNFSGSYSGNYFGRNPEFVNSAFEIFPPTATMSFFEDMGLLFREEYGGRVFPYSGQASTVLDVLRLEAERLGVEFLCESEVASIEKNDEGFRIKFSQGNKKLNADRVIVASGGCAAPYTGSDGAGFKILKKFGHNICEPIPALCPMLTENAITRSLKGIRFTGRVSAKKSGIVVDHADGEILFTDYGISGTAVFSLSRVFYTHSGGLSVLLDFMPEYSEDELMELLTKRREKLSELTAESFLLGTVNKKIGMVLLKRAGVAKLTSPVSSFTGEQVRAIASELKGMELKVNGPVGWDNAQITAGGAYTGEFFPKTMESKIVGGLYAVGEVLDIFGDCGGYNLQWAWSSGFLAGRAAASQFKKECSL